MGQRKITKLLSIQRLNVSLCKFRHSFVISFPSHTYKVVCLMPFKPCIILFIDTHASFWILYSYQVIFQVWCFCFLFGFRSMECNCSGIPSHLVRFIYIKVDYECMEIQFILHHFKFQNKIKLGYEGIKIYFILYHSKFQIKLKK